MRHLNVLGRVFGKLTVIAYEGQFKGGARWRCRCECGQERINKVGHLTTGAVISCGCYAKRLTKSGVLRRTHGKSRSFTYNVWCKMKERCSNPKLKCWENYGGRGIKVCDRWMKFENFLEDMGEGPTWMSIDRINNDGNYEPGNCWWATPKQQRANQRPYVPFKRKDGKPTRTKYAIIHRGDELS